MKIRIFIFMLAILSIANLSYSQERNDPLTGVTVQSDTSTIAPTYDDSYSGVVFYDGIAGFQFTVTNTADTLSKVDLQGSYDGVRFVTVSSLTTLVDGNYKISQSPPEYLEYQLKAYGAAEDTAVITYPTYFYKKTK